MAKYIYQHKNWPAFTWHSSTLTVLFGQVRHLQGKIAAQISSLGFTVQEEANLNTLAVNVVKSSEIEGEHLDYQQVRSSIARHLGINTGGLTSAGRHVEGVVDMMLDAAQNYQQPLTHNRLYSWHAALFPAGRSGLYHIETGTYRSGEMQIVSGAMGKKRVHFEAVPAASVYHEMDNFLQWFNHDSSVDLVIKAAIAHFWFIIIHPFDDGNGRIARAITDMLLARSDDSAARFYSMSGQIMAERKAYYSVLQQVQHSQGDITPWLQWFLQCLKAALHEAENTLAKVVYKAEFWQQHENTPLNERQRLVLNRLLGGFDGKLKSSKWAKIAKCSADTALRDIKDLIDKGILRQESQGGRSTNYELAAPPHR